MCKQKKNDYKDDLKISLRFQLQFVTSQWQGTRCSTIINIALMFIIGKRKNYCICEAKPNGTMHQVLSYETAVRANSSREFREYVTKRTCVSLVLTIGFLVLIVGYLLGNFVSERKYQIRDKLKQTLKNTNETPLGSNGDAIAHTVELSSDEYTMLKELQAYIKNKDVLLASAQKLSKLMQSSGSYKASALNSEIHNKYISCAQDIPSNTSLTCSQFIEELIDNTVARQRDCLRIIQITMDNARA